MKNFENFADLMAMFVGVLGALLKGLKNKFHASTIVLGCLIAGVLTYSIIGVIEYFYSDLNTKFIILISFSVGWVANEITEKMDLIVNDLYDILIEWLKSKFKKRGK